MERRYLVATLALVATFAIFSREFRSGHLANLPCSRAQLRAELACAKQYVAGRLVAKVRPFLERGNVEERQMMAEMNLPVLAAANEKIAEVQAQVAQFTAEKNYESAVREQERALRAQEAGLRAQERNLRLAERAQERAAEQMQARAMTVSMRASERAQAMSVRAVENAQRAINKSKWKIVLPNVPNAPSAPIPINFEINLPSDFDQQVRSAVQSRTSVQCVNTKVVAQQMRTVMTQRVNQNMRNNVHVVVSTQDVSGVSALTQSPAAHSATHKLVHDFQHLQDHVAATIDRAFATL